MSGGKDEGWIKELADTTQEIRKYIEEHEDDSPLANLRLVQVIPVLVTAVTNIEKRVSELENLEEVREIMKRGG